MELPRLDAIQKDYDTAQVRIITINLWESWSKVKQYANGNSCLFLRDGTGSVWNAYNHTSYIPLNYVLETDSAHTVHAWKTGFNETQMRNWINECLPQGIEENTNCKLQIAKLVVSPNPFTAVVSVQWSGISEANLKVYPTIQIYDLSGRLVKTLATNHLPLTPAVTWDGKDSNGVQVSSGVYFCRLTAGKVNLVEKLIVMK